MLKNQLTEIINNYQLTVSDDSRDYIGASSIGSNCFRQIWYQFKGAQSEHVPSKFRRTWDIGKRLESLIIKWLIDAGISVDIPGAHNNYLSFSAKDMPYFKGHFDGTLTLQNNNSSILEIKTAKDASFKIFEKKGLKEWNEQYYSQVHSYMGMSGINSAYILVLNKDNSDLSDELIKFDPNFYEKLKEKALMIYGANIPPPRINASPLWYQCKICKFNKVCHG